MPPLNWLDLVAIGLVAAIFFSAVAVVLIVRNRTERFRLRITFDLLHHDKDARSDEPEVSEEKKD